MPADPGTAAAAVIEQLERSGVRCAVGGALCLAYWGVPRATKDLDVNVFVTDAQLDPVLDALEAAGCVLDRAASRSRVRERGDLVAAFDDVRVDVFVAFHAYHDSVAGRVVRGRLPDGPDASFLSAEDLCVFKTLFFRDKDLVDLDRLFVAIGTPFDIEYAHRWLVELLGAGDPRPAEIVRRFRRAVGRPEA